MQKCLLAVDHSASILAPDLRLPEISSALHDGGRGGRVDNLGCCNRTLVPTGFPYEHRLYWRIPDIYHAFGPLLSAHRLTRPVLLLYGAEDDNPNTHPDQAINLHKAITATGGHAP